MCSASQTIEQAKAIAAEVDRDEVSVELASTLATFERRLEHSEHGAAAHARAVVKLAQREGVDVEAAKPKRTKADLRAEVDALGLDVPKSATVADLEQALAEHHDSQE